MSQAELQELFLVLHKRRYELSAKTRVRRLILRAMRKRNNYGIQTIRAILNAREFARKTYYKDQPNPFLGEKFQVIPYLQLV